MQRLFVWMMTLAAALTCVSCSSRLFRYTVDVNLASSYTLDQTGTFTQQSTITSSDVARAFNLPAGARVNELVIESLSIRAVMSDRNTATVMNVTGTQQSSAEAAATTLFSNYAIPLTGGSIAEWGLNQLIEGGIDRLKSNLQDMAKNLGASRLNYVTLKLTGTSSPAGTRMVLGLQFTIKATVKYERCESIPWSDVGEPCPGVMPTD